MHAVELGVRVLAIAYGAGAALLAAAAFYIIGVGLVPRGSRLAGGETPLLIALATYVLVCWFGVARHVRIPTLTLAFVAAGLLLAIVRAKAVASAVRAASGERTRAWILSFAALYTLTYCFLAPPVTREWLPIAWLGNIDVMTYIRYTQHFVLGRQWNTAGQSGAYIDYVYLQTPAVFYLYGTLSLFFREGVLQATMPVVFTFASWLGLMVARASRDIFGIPRWSALAIGGLAISAPFYRFIVAEYFLSSVMALPILVFLVWKTIVHVPRRALDMEAAVEYAAAYVLLLFLYPLLLLIGVGVQLGAIVLMAIADARSDPNTPATAPLRTAGARAATLALPLLVLAVALFGRVTWVVDEVAFLSRSGVAGWAMTMISPWAVLGFPGTAGDQVQCLDCLNVGSATHPLPVLGLAAFAVIALVLVGIASRPQVGLSAGERAAAGIAAGAMLIYPAAFLAMGPSYQQWKFASYTAMPFAFVLVALMVRLAAVRARVLGTTVASIVVLGVFGNLYVHAQWDPPMMRLTGDLRNLWPLDKDPSFTEMTLRMSESTGVYPTWMALYFLPSKIVHVVSEEFRPREPLSYETVTPHRPLLLDGVGCDGIGHGDARDVAGIGCLTSRPPSFELDSAYPFNRSYVFIALTGFGEREPEGRWPTAREATVTLVGDIQRVNLFEPAFVNLRWTPYVPPGTRQQRLIVSWGSNRRTARIASEQPSVISIPVRRDDWSGTRVWSLPLSLSFPDAVSPPWMYAPRGKPDAPPLAGVFEEMSVTRTPRGVVVPAAPADGEPVS